MKQFEGFKSEAPAKKFPTLPAGTYVAAIKNVKIDGQEPDQQRDKSQISQRIKNCQHFSLLMRSVPGRNGRIPVPR